MATSLCTDTCGTNFHTKEEKMNGDSQKIFDAIISNGQNIAVLQSEVKTIRKTQEQQHQENKDALEKIEGHETECNTNHSSAQAHIKIQWFIIALIIGGLITMYLGGK